LKDEDNGRRKELYLFNSHKKKKKIYYVHIVMSHESEAWAVIRWPDWVC